MTIRYSKIKIIGSTKSRSMDFSDLSLTFPELKKPDTNTTLTPLDTNQIKNTNSTNTTNNINTTQDSFSMLEEEEQESKEERFNAAKLRRNSSVSSSASALQSAVKRAFSMRRSSSVSERYCRIHDQPVSLSSPIYDEDGGITNMDRMERTRSMKKKPSRSRILKACKKLFGL